MSRGHGAPGLVDSIRTLIDLQDDSAASRRPYLDFFPGVNLTAAGWSLSSGAAYIYTAGFIYFTLGGMTLDVVGVDTSLGTLNRVETLADCIATAGTFYATPNVGDSSAVPTWDGGTLWDAAGVTWDHVTTTDLYVHLAGDANPNAQTVVPLLGLFFATKGETHPQLGPEKLTNGGFESLAGWSEMATPGWDDGVTTFDVGGFTWDSSPITSSLDSSLFIGRGSTSSLKLAYSGTGTGTDSRSQDLPTLSGATYRLSGYYQTSAGMSSNLAARLLVGNTAGTTILYEDGRDGNASGQATLTPTGGEWRRFLFDFLAPATTTRVQLQLNATAGAAGQVNFDGVSLKRVYRYVFYEPRLAADALADVQVGSQSIFFDTKDVGLSSVSLIDADAALAPLLAQLLTTNRTARVATGGSFPDGREVYRDDWFNEFYGLTRDMWVSDEKIDCNLDDPFTLLLDTILPLKKQDLSTFPNMDPSRAGQVQPLLFGDFTTAGGVDIVVPNRVGLTTAGYGIYQLCDTTGTPGLDYATVLLYLTAPLRDQDPAHQDYTYDAHGAAHQAAYTFDPSTGLLTINHNIGDYLYDKSGQLIYLPYMAFSIGGGALFGPSGDKSAELDRDYMTQQWSLFAADIAWFYDTATHKFRATKGAGTFSLLCSSGAAYTKTCFQRHGFHTDVDRTGALSYTADDPVFTSPETDHVFGAFVRGIKDDGSGTYGGTAGALLKKPGDIFNLIMRVYLGATVDQVSITAARTSTYGSKSCRLFMNTAGTARDWLKKLAVSAMADVVVDGSGTWYFQAYTAGTPADVIDFYDRDYLSFKIGKRPSDVFKNVEVWFGKRPTASDPQKSQYVYDSGIPTKAGQRATLTVDSALAVQADSDALGAAVAKLAASQPRIAEFASRGKLVGVLPGRKIRLTRQRGLDSTGALNAVLFRVMALRRSPLSGVTTCTAVEDVPFA